MSVGEKIKFYREKKGLTQEQLGSLINVKGATITRYEKNDRQPKIEQLTKIATALDVKINELLPYHISIAGESTLPSELKPLDESYSKASKQILSDLQILNTKGQLEAAKRINELTKLEEYTKEGE